MFDSSPFLPGSLPELPGPVSRFLPPIPEGVATEWLTRHLEEHSGNSPSWVLDPFGASPSLSVEIAQAGYCVLVASVNPVTRFITEIAANPPGYDEFKASLADFGALPKGNNRLEPYLNSLYQTECSQCNQNVIAQAYIWERDATAPSKRIYNCPYCGETGEFPVNDKDKARARRFSASSLHRARALERVAPLNDPDRVHVEEALEVYLPRALYSLFTVINKLESLQTRKRQLLTALTLSACDQVNTLWGYPTARARPRQLTTPSQYIEQNIWNVLENAVDQWINPHTENQNEIQVTIWPEQPHGGKGICLYEGRMIDLAREINSASSPNIRFRAAASALPRPNQAFWTLSALWAGWLWGREAAAPFKSVIRRRRYDWAWHSSALKPALLSINTLLDPGIQIFSVIGELEPGFLSSALLAGEFASLELVGLALRDDEGQAQITWKIDETRRNKTSTNLSPPHDDRLVDISRKAVRNYLEKRGEPAGYIHLHASAYVAIIKARILDTIDEDSSSLILSHLNNIIQQALSYSGGFVRYEGSEHSFEIGKWWLHERSDQTADPLSDRVEKQCVELLLDKPGWTLLNLDKRLCADYRGLLTPNQEIITECLKSYAEQYPSDSSVWNIRSQDTPVVRQADLKEIINHLKFIAERLDYSQQVRTDKRLIWTDEEGETRYIYYLEPSSILGQIVFNDGIEPAKSIIVLPGGRANIVTYKLHNDPFLRQTIEQGWRFLKFRHVRRLVQEPNLNRENIDEQLSLDPLMKRDPQIPMW